MVGRLRSRKLPLSPIGTQRQLIAAAIRAAHRPFSEAAMRIRLNLIQIRLKDLLNPDYSYDQKLEKNVKLKFLLLLYVLSFNSLYFFFHMLDHILQ
jgi:hypothetical protein